MHSRKRGITPERQDSGGKKFRSHTKFQDSSISGSRVSQLPKSVMDRQMDRRTDGQTE